MNKKFILKIPLLFARKNGALANKVMMDPTHEINKEITERYFKNFDSIYGWFNILSAKSLLWLDFIQKKENVEGNIFEIGVLLGKSAILLGLFVNQEKERLGLCDHFMAGGELKTLQKEIFYKNLNSYFKNLNFIDFYEKDSTTKLTQDECKNCRLFHIDGGHTFKHLTNDLNLADNGIIEKGLILIDDFFNPRCPEVTEGVYQYLKEKSTLLPLLIAFGKLILCKRSMYCWYLEKINSYNWKIYIREEVELLKAKMFDHQVLTFRTKPSKLQDYLVANSYSSV